MKLLFLLLSLAVTAASAAPPAINSCHAVVSGSKAHGVAVLQ
ncbi:hypothetical protein [Myxococcus guangdongensis]|nr:hypothetical protein [Myxococcus guangdongensis]